MNHELKIDDLFEGEDDTLGRGLFDALGQLRPEPDAFQRGVQQRIEAGETRVEARVPDFVRRAAAVLPPVLLPKGFAKLGLGGAAASKAGSKFLPGIMAFPVISVLMVFVTLGLGVRRVFLGTANSQRQNERAAKHDTAEWWRRHWLPAVALFGFSLFLLFEAPSEALTLLFTISTLAFLGIFASLARAGFATRREVGRRAASALFWMAGLSVQLSFQPNSAGLRAPAFWLVPGILLAGTSICLGLASRSTPVDRTKLKRFFAAMLALAAFFFALRLDTLSQSEGTVAKLEAWLEETTDTSQVQQTAQIVANLRAAGLQVPDLANLRKGARARLDRELADDSFNGTYAPAMIDLGLFEEWDFERLRDDRAAARLVASGTTYLNLQSAWTQTAVQNHFEPYSEEERALLVERVLAKLDPEDQYANGQLLVMVVRLLESLGAADRVPELAPAVETVLRATWAPTSDGQQAAFAPYRNNIERDADGRSAVPRLTFVWGQDTAASVWLLARFGVPEFVDLQPLDAYLHENSYYWKTMGFSPYIGEAVASRALLHSLPTWEATAEDRVPTWFERLVALRVLLGALVLTGSAVALTLRASD